MKKKRKDGSWQGSSIVATEGEDEVDVLTM